MTSLEELYTFFEAILVIALSEYVGSNENGEKLPSELSLQYLNTIIKNVSAPEVSDEINYYETDKPEEVNDQNISD